MILSVLRCGGLSCPGLLSADVPSVSGSGFRRAIAWDTHVATSLTALLYALLHVHIGSPPGRAPGHPPLHPVGAFVNGDNEVTFVSQKCMQRFLREALRLTYPNPQHRLCQLEHCYKMRCIQSSAYLSLFSAEVPTSVDQRCGGVLQP
jgi:hypothetical protein